MAELPESGWDFEYVELAPEARTVDFSSGRAGPSRSSQLLPTAGLVDSGCEHTLAARWLLDDAGVDERHADRLTLGIGGRVVEALFVPVTMRLHPDHSGGDFVEWHTEVGFVEPWDAESFVILGQLGFFDEFMVSMSRTSLTVHIEPNDALHRRLSNVRE